MKHNKAARDYLIPLAENFFLVPGPEKSRYPYSNGFLILGEETLLIDAGIGEKAMKTIDKAYHIDHLLISHSHCDHIEFWHILEDRHLLLPKETPDSVTDLTELCVRLAGSREDGAYWEKHVWRERGFVPLRLPDRRYSHGEILDMGQIQLEAIHTPGHLNDHYCFFEHTNGILLSVDIDFDNFGPWYGNPESSPSIFEEKTIEISKLPYSTICSSHRPPMDKETGKVALNAFIEKFETHRQIILNMCKKPTSLDSLTDDSPFFKNRLPDLRTQAIFERIIIRKILDGLIDVGKIEEENGLYQNLS